MMILVVGTLGNSDRARLALSDLEDFHFASFGELTAGLLADLAPRLVLSPLLGQGFDAIDVARRLDNLGFIGSYRAITRPIPNLDMIRDEVAGTAPHLDFDLFVLKSQFN